MAKITDIHRTMTRIEGHMGVHVQADPRAKYTEALLRHHVPRPEDISYGVSQRTPSGWRSAAARLPHFARHRRRASGGDTTGATSPFGLPRNLAHMAKRSTMRAWHRRSEGPDYPKRSFLRTPSLPQSQHPRTACRHSRYSTIGDVMRAFNPISGSFWMKCLEAAKTAGI
jgi:hypothetical protein